MGPALVIGGIVAVGLLVAGETLRRSGPPASRGRTPPFRRATPWVAGSALLVGCVLLAIPGLPPVVVVCLTVYAAFAVTAIWRMASLDSGSRWMTPSRRRGRIVISIVAVVWLGLVLGLLLRIADLVAGALPEG